MTTMGVALQAWEGKGDWTKGTKYRNIRAMFPMYDTPFHFITLEKSGIKSVKDLAGKRSGVGPRAGTCGTYFPADVQDARRQHDDPQRSGLGHGAPTCRTG